MIIRSEKESDFNEIYKLIKNAFETAQVSNGKEQDFYAKLKKGENYIPELAIVAEDAGEITGHIMLTKTFIFNGNIKYETLLLAPISVVLEKRNQGIGSKLINESFKLAKEMGYKSAVLVGNPNYYSRFGFKSSIDFGIKNKNGIPDEYVMACELEPNALSEINGLIEFETE